MSRRSKRAKSPDEVSMAIAASPDKLYDIVSDVTRMGRLSPECKGGRWVGTVSGPSVGAEFRGRNRRGPVFWWTRNRIVTANRGREFAFETKQSGYRWRYRFDPAGDVTVVTESREPFRRRPLVARLFTMLMLGGIGDHDEEMREGMRASLERLRGVAESLDSSPKRRRRSKVR